MHEPTTYEIVIRGHATERILGPLLDEFAIDHPEAGTTRMTGEIRDPAHLHGVLARLTSFAIEVVRVCPVDPTPESTNRKAQQ